MFEITFFVEDNKLAKALTALDGLGFDLQVVPVKNAKLGTATSVATAKGSKRRKVMSAGGATTCVSFVQSMLEKKLEQGESTISSAEVTKAATHEGFSKGSAVQALIQSVGRGDVTRMEKGIYHINGVTR